MGIVKRADWSKSYSYVPRDNLFSHGQGKSRQFISSFAHDPCAPAMNLLIGWEYGRIWLKERNCFAAKRAVMVKPKRIRNDFKWWLDKRKNGTKTCCHI